MPGICKCLVPLQRTLKVNMSGLPHSLARSEPVVYSWNLRWLFCPQKEGGLVAENALEWREAGGVLPKAIRCMLGPREVAGPAVFVVLKVCLEVMP